MCRGMISGSISVLAGRHGSLTLVDSACTKVLPQFSLRRSSVFVAQIDAWGTWEGGHAWRGIVHVSYELCAFALGLLCGIIRVLHPYFAGIPSLENTTNKGPEYDGQVARIPLAILPKPARQDSIGVSPTWPFCQSDPRVNQIDVKPIALK